jgi:thiol-disulfide isomerase/thioredoxin
MNKIFTKTFLTTILSCLLFINSYAQGYNIKIKIKGADSLEAQLAYYQGDKQYVVKADHFNKNGEVVFQDKKATLATGIYFVVVGQMGFFDVLIRNEQGFSIQTDTTDLINEMKVKGSKENEVFFEYQKKLIEEKKQLAALHEKKKNLSKNNDSIAIYDDEINSVNLKMEQIAKETQQKYPDSYIAKLIEAMNMGNIDDFDFADGDYLRTPFFHNMVRLFIKKNVEKHPEYIKYQTKNLLDAVKKTTDNYRYIATYLLNFYSTFYKVGMNEVFVFIADNYFLPNKANWLNNNHLDQIKERRDFLAQSLPGMPAQDITMESTTGEFFSLFQIENKIVLLYFWSANCGHCDESTAILKENYKALQEKGIEIYAVNVDKKGTDWKKKIEKKEIEWLNCYDPEETSGYRDKYFVFGSPLLYVIDTKKKLIVARGNGEEDIGKLVEELVKQK